MGSSFSRAWRAVSVAACLITAVSQPVAAANLSGTAFPATTQAGGSTLVLNGAGTRHRAVFKVYDLALYLPHKAKTAEEVLAMPGPKRLDFTAMREISATDLGLAMVQGMRANATKEQTTRYLSTTMRLVEVFSVRSKLMAGEKFGLRYVPNKGSYFYIGDEQQGEPMGDAEYFGMVLKIWLGGSPADPLLKDALLSD